jgi:hypothetical protein
VTIQDYGSIGELIGAFATVATLAYLASQIRQNTRAVRAAAVDSSISHSMDVRKSMYESEALTRIYASGSDDPEALSEEDLVRFRLLYHNVMLSLWNIFSQTRLAGLPAETWSAQVPLLQRVLSTKGGKWFWANYCHEFEPSFQQEVTRVSADSIKGS